MKIKKISGIALRLGIVLTTISLTHMGTIYLLKEMTSIDLYWGKGAIKIALKDREKNRYFSNNNVDEGKLKGIVLYVSSEKNQTYSFDYYNPDDPYMRDNFKVIEKRVANFQEDQLNFEAVDELPTLEVTSYEDEFFGEGYRVNVLSDSIIYYDLFDEEEDTIYFGEESTSESKNIEPTYEGTVPSNPFKAIERTYSEEGFRLIVPYLGFFSITIFSLFLAVFLLVLIGDFILNGLDGTSVRSSSDENSSMNLLNIANPASPLNPMNWM